MYPNMGLNMGPNMFASMGALVLLLQVNAVLITRTEAGKIDCYPIEGASKERCESLGCVWAPVEKSGRRPGDSLAGLDSGLARLSSSLDGEASVETKSRVDEPWCYHPDSYVGYKVLESSQYEIKLERVKASAMETDVKNLVVRLTPLNEGELLRIQVLDADHDRFVPELPEINVRPASLSAPAPAAGDTFKIELVHHEPADGGQAASVWDKPHKLVIRRLSSGAIIFATDLSKLIYSDKFIQLDSELSSVFVFGLGEHYDTFLKLADVYKTYSFYNTDRLPLAGGTRSYGGFPFFVNLDSANQSQAHGVYLRNSNAMDIVLHDSSATFRPIGGTLDFFLFIGPTPMEVIGQYQRLVGLPELPPRWSLGFHLCRYDYKSLARTREIWQRTRDANIPFDVQWNDIDYMDRGNDFTYDQARFGGLPEFVDELHRLNMHYMLIFDPGVSQEPNYYPYSLGERMDIFIKNSTNQTLVGKVWNESGRTVFPDFSNPLSERYWSELFVRFQRQIAFDGAWIDMNDISNFVDGSLDGCPLAESPLERPPYRPGGYSLQKGSLCLSARHKAGREYDLHNLYSFYETIATRRALEAARPGRRSLIISRSTQPGQGRFGGHWSGDVPSSWPYLRWSIGSLLEHSMYGFSMIGSDICGFLGNTSEALCARWSTLGAFYTFSRNHNDDRSMDQDPVALGPVVVAANRNAFRKRYSLLPYLYTLMHQASRQAQPVARHMAFEFFQQHDPEALRAEHQFMWGPALLIAPIVAENETSKSTYLPAGRWYELDIRPESMSSLQADERASVPKVVNARLGAAWHTTNQVALDNLVLFYRGGHIIPVYAHVRQTIPETVEQPVALEVALCPLERARGSLILDDGESLEPRINQLQMQAGNGLLEIRLERDDYTPEVHFGQVKVYGLSTKVSRVSLLRPGPNETSLEFRQKEHMLIFELAGARASKSEEIRVKWS